jgi:GDPmannose 4,6-dehydratase
MWLTLQHDTPQDFVFATGVLHSVQDIVEQAFHAVGLDWKTHLRQDERFMRRAEPHRLVGNPAKAATLLHWQPSSNFASLIGEMTFAELAELSR